MEDEGLLDPVDEVDLFALHFVFLPRINQQLLSFKEAYCRHKLRTEQNHTPLQLWTRGILATEDSTALAGVLGSDEMNEVSVPPLFQHLSRLFCQTLHSLSLFLSHTHTQEQALEYGIDWFGPSSAEETESCVIVPEIPNYLNTCQLSFLQSLVDPLKPCDDYGKGFYVITRQLVREMIEC